MHIPAMNVPSKTAIEIADEPSTSCSIWNQMISYISAAQPLPRNSSSTNGNIRSLSAGASPAARLLLRRYRYAPARSSATITKSNAPKLFGFGGTTAGGSPFFGLATTAIGASVVFSAGGKGVGAAQYAANSAIENEPSPSASPMRR